MQRMQLHDKWEFTLEIALAEQSVKSSFISLKDNKNASTPQGGIEIEGCWFVKLITQKLLIRFPRQLDRRCVSAQNSAC